MKKIMDICIFKEIVPNFVIGSNPKRMSMSLTLLMDRLLW